MASGKDEQKSQSLDPNRVNRGSKQQQQQQVKDSSSVSPIAGENGQNRESIMVDEIRETLEQVFSLYNIENDKLLQNKMDREGFVRLIDVLEFPAVKQTLSTLLNVSESSKKDQISLLKRGIEASRHLQFEIEGIENAQLVRYVHQVERKTLIIREMSKNITKKDILSLFNEKPHSSHCGHVSSSGVKCDIGNNWFVTFDTEQDCLSSFKYLTENNIRLKGETLHVRVKSSASTHPLVGHGHGLKVENTSIVPPQLPGRRHIDSQNVGISEYAQTSPMLPHAITAYGQVRYEQEIYDQMYKTGTTPPPDKQHQQEYENMVLQQTLAAQAAHAQAQAVAQAQYMQQQAQTLAAVQAAQAQAVHAAQHHHHQVQGYQQMVDQMAMRQQQLSHQQSKQRYGGGGGNGGGGGRRGSSGSKQRRQQQQAQGGSKGGAWGTPQMGPNGTPLQGAVTGSGVAAAAAATGTGGGAASGKQDAASRQPTCDYPSSNYAKYSQKEFLDIFKELKRTGNLQIPHEMAGRDRRIVSEEVREPVSLIPNQIGGTSGRSHKRRKDGSDKKENDNENENENESGKNKNDENSNDKNKDGNEDDDGDREDERSENGSEDEEEEDSQGSRSDRGDGDNDDDRDSGSLYSDEYGGRGGRYDEYGRYYDDRGVDIGGNGDYYDEMDHLDLGGSHYDYGGNRIENDGHYHYPDTRYYYDNNNGRDRYRYDDRSRRYDHTQNTRKGKYGYGHGYGYDEQGHEYNYSYDYDYKRKYNNNNNNNNNKNNNNRQNRNSKQYDYDYYYDYSYEFGYTNDHSRRKQGGVEVEKHQRSQSKGGGNSGSRKKKGGKNYTTQQRGGGGGRSQKKNQKKKNGSKKRGKSGEKNNNNKDRTPTYTTRRRGGYGVNTKLVYKPKDGKPKKKETKGNGSGWQKKPQKKQDSSVVSNGDKEDVKNV